MAKLLTIDDAAQVMRLSASTIRRLITSGKLIPVRANSAIRISPLEIDRYIKVEMAQAQAHNEARRRLARRH